MKVFFLPLSLLVIGLAITLNLDDFHECVYEYDTKGACGPIITHIVWFLIWFFIAVFVFIVAVSGAIYLLGEYS